MITKQTIEEKIDRIVTDTDTVHIENEGYLVHDDAIKAILTLFLDSFEEMVGEDEKLTGINLPDEWKDTHVLWRNELRQELRAKIQKLREEK